jgi:serine/threonine protein kinase/Tol biopolymer transport system component
MTLAPGIRVGPYEIVDALGAGAMGEVYRAVDSGLDRTVALKILPDEFAADADRVARFEREAKTLASLNHPHIAQIYGLERRHGSPHDAPAGVLVMEYVDGEDLSRRMSRGPMPVDVALPIARQIAEAIEAAHEHGVVHRDLKPANVKVRPDGSVKVLDFGLAKIMESAAAQGHQSTLTAHETELGTVLGTAPYMAPEQARGRPVDKRADIWAFGVVLFEMLSGRRLFAGQTTTEILASVLSQPIPWELLPTATPPHVRRLLERCLEPDPRLRLRDMGEARIVLGSESAPASTVDERPLKRSPWRRGLGVAVLAGIAGVLGFAAASLSRDSSETRAPLRFPIEVPFSLGLTRPGVNPVLSVSPDGRTIALAASRSIWVWSAQTGTLQRLADTVGARAPFFSHDGREIGFFTADELRRIPASGGVATTIVRTPGGGAGAWAADGTILFHRWIGEGGMWRVNVQGGEPQLITPAGDGQELRRAPALLPDGRHYVFITGQLSIDERQMCVGSVDSAETTCFGRGDSNVVYSPTGHLLFVRRGQLMALPFDATALRPTGEAMPVNASVRWFGPTGIAAFALSGDGRTLVYQPPSRPSRLVWVNRTTRALTPIGEPARFGSVLLSPDETKVATEIWNDQTEGRDLYLVDLASGIPTRVTREKIDAIAGSWSRDGRLVFSRAADSPPDLFIMPIDRPSDAKPLLRKEGVQVARHWSADGQTIAFVDQSVGEQEHVGIQLISPDGHPREFRNVPDESFDPRFSPDGRWLAYAAFESERPEIYVAPSDGRGAPRRLSRNGGVLPRWRGDGHELFFVQFDGMMVAVNPADTLPVPSLLFRLEGALPSFSDYRDSERWFDYDVTADGQRFLIRQPVPGAESVDNLRVVIDWLSDARR